MSAEYSVESLLEFLDYLANKGLVKRATIIARKAAVNNMLAILDAGEKSDLRQLDVELISSRFATLSGSRYSPQSLKEYKTRLRNSLADFLKYKENPANFKVSTGSRVVTRRKPSSAPTTATMTPVADEVSGSALSSASTFNVPVPVRPGVLVQLNGIPTDLTRAEATKIANVVLAMATSTEHQQ